MIAARLAPAKVNLFLHVAPLQPDGYHPLASLMSFADVGDRLELWPAEKTGFDLDGPFAPALAGEDPAGNLAWRAVQALLARSGATPPPFRLKLVKELPVAAGLGGGSSDAGAALKLVRDAFAPATPDGVLEVIAGELGADGPACLAARPVIAQGRGDRLSEPPPTPVLHAVLVNPGVACPTGRVYRAYDEAGAPGDCDLPALPPRFDTAEALIPRLAQCRNDLEAPAITVAPVVAEMLELLRARPDTRLARLSGSGATGFALCADAPGAGSLAVEVQALRPGWWVRPCRIGDPWARPGEDFTTP